MVYEPHGNTQWIAISQDTAAERAPACLEREFFFSQLANALTMLNGWVYLTQTSACPTRQQCYFEAMQSTVQHIIHLMQRHR
ncbi:hypothetical protein [Candidatus Entotheonella palauensis]|uniref:Uncharacterized protein n=1 Tax=Candidatus Entotheonella gemina TaxID=1429439 RepID=W4MFY8_9BACT|nr:hypothetical protein [Candidatus Entotheonella palauensis]ETX09239.1 MAG: hypothetical protein ETSY2_00705 [Candidatus Entotheonella gemina]